MSYRDEDAKDEARCMADTEPEPHRCGVPAYYGCRICMNAADDPDEDEDQCAHEWVVSDPEEGGDGRCYCLNCDADGDG